MENQEKGVRKLRQRKVKEEEEGIDLISKLPEPILQHILCFLSQRYAIQTCTLSKSWRHVGSTRPKISFHALEDFKGNQEALVSVLDQTLQSYHDWRLSVREFDVRLLLVDQTLSVPVLEKWIPLIMMSMGVEIFHLFFCWEDWKFFDVPSVVFEAESLQKLYLKRCRLNPIDKVLCKHLQTLYLTDVFIAEETLVMLLSNCPLIENLTLLGCFGLRNIRVVDKPRALKHIVVGDAIKDNKDDPISIEIEFPTISTVEISRCWLPHHNMYLPHLTRLFLSEVRLSCKSVDFFSCNFPCIHEMKLFHCSGFKEFNLSSHSIRHLSIVNPDNGLLCKAAIYAPSIVRFNYIGPILQSFSFTTTSSEWKSDIYIRGFYAVFEKGASAWFHKLNGLLTELRQSKIYLTVAEPRKIKKINIDGVFHDKPNPVVVERLMPRSSVFVRDFILAFLNSLFLICRPRYIGQYFHNALAADQHNKFLEFLYEIFLKEGETRDHHFSWPCGLEEVSMEAFDMNINEWRRVQSISSVEARAAVEFRFRLKWRELI